MLWHMSTMRNLNEEVPAGQEMHAATASDRSASDADKHLRATLDRGTNKDGSKRVSLTTVKGRGIRPGIDLDRSASLLELMERPE